MERSTFAKVRLTRFHCSRCKVKRKYSLVERSSGRTPGYLCENCGSVFVAGNVSLVAMGYGVVVGVIAASASGPIYTLVVRTEIPDGWVILAVFLIFVPVSWLLWMVFAARLIHFKYVGRVDT